MSKRARDAKKATRKRERDIIAYRERVIKPALKRLQDVIDDGAFKAMRSLR